MKILVISSYVPYPLYSGGQVRLFNLIRELSQEHEITLVCERRSKHTVSQEEIAQLEKICKKVIIVDAPKQWSIKNILKAGISPTSFLLAGHTHVAMQAKIAELLKSEKFAVIHVETFYVMQNLPKTDIPVVLAEHNIEYQVYQRFMERAPQVLRPFLAIDIAKIKKEEEHAWKRATRLVVVSQEDKKVMEQAGLHPIVVANGVNTEQFSFKEIKDRSTAIKKILFIGDFKWLQNRDTIAWILKEIWPKVSVKLKAENSKLEVKLWIVGRKIPQSVKSLTTDTNVLFDEENSAQPTQELFQQATVLLAPIRVGGGTSYKILESMASGTPTVITALSANALQAEDGKEVMVGDTADIIADKTVMLLQNEELYTKIARNGRAFIEKKYTWKEITKVLEHVYKELL